MGINNLVLKASNAFDHVLAGGLGSHAIYNASQGNYEWAALEAIAATWIEVKKYQEGKHKQFLDDFYQNKVPSLIERADELDKKRKRIFKKLNSKLDAYLY